MIGTVALGLIMLSIPDIKPSTRKVTKEELRPILEKIKREYLLPPDLILAQIEVESGFRNITGEAGEIGLLQVLVKTGRDMGYTEDELYEIEAGVLAGAKYLRMMLNRYENCLPVALWAYNAGPGAVDRGIIPKKTRNYAEKVMRIYGKITVPPFFCIYEKGA